MKWILVIILVTQNGESEVHTDFGTLEACKAAQQVVLQETELDENFVSLSTECRYEFTGWSQPK